MQTSSSTRLTPVFPHPCIHLKGDRQGIGSLHFLDDKASHELHLLCRDLEEEFVVNLEYHPASQALCLKPSMDPYHGELDDVGGAPLDGGVDRNPLAKLPDAIVAARQLRQIPPSLEECRDIAGLLCLCQGLFDKLPDPFVSGEVVINILLCLLLGDADVGCQSKGAHPVHNAEVDRLCPAAHLRGDLRRRESEDLCRGPRMDVLTLLECGSQQLIPGHVGQDTEFDLGVIRRQEQTPLVCRKGLPDPLSHIRPYGNILEIGLAARQPPCGCYRLTEGGVHTAGGRIYESEEGVYIGGFEFCNLPVAEYLRRELMLEGKLCEHRLIC